MPIEIEYFVDRDDMSDEEYSNQEFRKFIITEDMLRELVEDNVELKKGERVCDNNFFVNLK